jgi:RNA polymerase sigma factor (sigma-70 family)
MRSNIDVALDPLIGLRQLRKASHQMHPVAANPSRFDTTPSPYRTDPALVRACLDGDEAAWKGLVERYGRLVYSIPRRYGLSAADADDVFQNVFTIVLRHLGDLRKQTSLSAWLITITRREAQHFGSSAKPTSELDENVVDDKAPPLEDFQHYERAQTVRQALTRLAPRDRDLLTALLQDPPPSYVELATRFELAVGSIGATRARSFRKLEAVLVDMGFEGDS